MISGMKNQRITRKTGPYKLGNKPAGIGTTKYSKYQFRANSYKYYEQIPQVLKEINNPHKFSKCVKRWLNNHDDLPTNRNSTTDAPDQAQNPTMSQQAQTIN